MSTGNNKILHTPLEELPIGNSLRVFMQENCFKTLAGLLKKPVAKLLQLPGMTTHILTELVTFLEMHNLAEELKHESLGG